MSQASRAILPASCARCDHFAAHPRFPKYGLCDNPDSPKYHACVPMFRGPLHVKRIDACLLFTAADTSATANSNETRPSNG